MSGVKAAIKSTDVQESRERSTFKKRGKGGGTLTKDYLLRKSGRKEEASNWRSWTAKTQVGKRPVTGEGMSRGARDQAMISLNNAWKEEIKSVRYC